MRRRSWLVAGVGVQLIAACSLIYPAGDFLGEGGSATGGTAGPGPTTSTGAGGAGGQGGTGMGGAPPGVVARVFVGFGKRDRPLGAPMSFDADLNDLLISDMDATGHLSDWRHTAPAPFTGSMQLDVVGGVFLAFGRVDQIDAFDRPSVLFASVTPDGVADDWVVASDTTVYNSDGSVVAYGQGRGYILGGTLTQTTDAGVVTNSTVDTYFLPIDEAAKTIAPRAPTADLLTARYRFGTLVHADKLYVVGGYNGSALPLTEYAPVNADGSLGAFVAGPGLVDDRAAVYPIYYPALCASDTHLYVAGGSLASTSRSDLVLASAFDASGGLGPWVAMTKLPAPVTQAACFVHDGVLFVLGGEGQTERSAQVLSSPILPADGSLGAWAAEEPELPLPRSDFALRLVPF